MSFAPWTVTHATKLLGHPSLPPIRASIGSHAGGGPTWHAFGGDGRRGSLRGATEQAAITKIASNSRRVGVYVIGRPFLEARDGLVLLGDHEFEAPSVLVMGSKDRG